jgi:hypothetical protein
MKASIAAFLVCASLALASVAKADIMAWSCNNDHDGAINCVQTGWDYDQVNDVYNLGIKGDHLLWQPGHMLMDFTTSDATDPTINSLNAITNDTGIAWTSYLVNVELDANAPLLTYNISNLGVTLPGDWTSTITQPLTYEGIVGGQYVYQGMMVLQSGTPIADGDELDFHYKLSFSGATGFHAIQEMTPVPEPSTLALLAVGVFGVLLVMRRR